MSRVPRWQEHLKTGFTAEAVAAARYRAYAFEAEREGMPRLAGEWRQLAGEKDELARIQLEAAEQLRGPSASVADGQAEERFENEVLYPKMIGEVDGEIGGVFRRVIAAQERHAERLRRMRQALAAGPRDVDLPAEVEA